jgi:hypothetical protein
MPVAPQNRQDTAATFQRLAARLVNDRLDGNDSPESVQEEALTILDRLALEELNSPTPNLAALNERLGKLVVTGPPVGESYRVVGLGDAPSAPDSNRAYALVANFGLSGPSSVRLYAGAPGQVRRVARIDRFRQKDFFDEFLELVPLAGGGVMFATVTGRTDELQTGAFAAWRLDGDTLKLLWFTEVLQQSSYEAAADGFRVTFCAETEEERPRVCRQMVRERYIWTDGAWKRAERQVLPTTKP